MSWEEEASYSVGRDAERRRVRRKWLLVVVIVMAFLGSVVRLLKVDDRRYERAGERE